MDNDVTPSPLSALSKANRTVTYSFLHVIGVIILASSVFMMLPLSESAFGTIQGENGKIAFGSNYEIYVMNADGSGQTRLTNNPVVDFHPSWSPDGTKIAFHSNRDGNYEIYVMNADGSGQTRLTNNPAFDSFPDWSLDVSSPPEEDTTPPVTTVPEDITE